MAVSCPASVAGGRGQIPRMLGEIRAPVGRWETRDEKVVSMLRRCSGRLARALTVPALVVAAAAALPAMAAQAGSLAGPAGAAAPASKAGVFNNVAVRSADDAWAVGHAGRLLRPGALIAHWNGTAWRRVALPAGIAGGWLDGVAALSARDVWAVGLVGMGFAGFCWGFLKSFRLSRHTVTVPGLHMNGYSARWPMGSAA